MNLIRALESGSILNCCHSGRRQRLFFWAIACCAVFLFPSCNTKKYLREDQSFLKDNKITIKSDHKVDDEADLKEKLATLYRQRETRTLAGIPRHLFYYQYQERLRRDSINNRVTKKLWSEEKLIRNRPVIYDSIKTEQTTEDFEKYLNLRGYREAAADYKVLTKDKESTVTYMVDPGPRLYLDTFIIATTDSTLRSIIDAEIDETFFKEGSPLDIELFNQEKSRIVDDFQNEGYARFDETYIAPLEVDTAGGRIATTMRILNENDSILHTRYYVGDVTFYPDYNQFDTIPLYDTIIRDVRYVTPGPELTLKPEAIERNLFLHRGDLTRRDNYLQTHKNLSRMELIKFVTPSLVVDTARLDTMHIDTPHIDYTFYLTRNKKLADGINFEFNYANINKQKRALFGISASANYRDLNVFKGAEILGINLEGGVEFDFFNRQAGEDGVKKNAINSRNFGIGTNLSFPRFMDPLKLYHMIGYSRKEDQPALLGNRLRRWLLYDATTRLNLNYNYIDIRDLYKYYNATASLTYNIKPDQYRTLSIDRTGVDLFVPTPRPDFIKILEQSRFQKESFGKYLFTGLLFRKYLYEYIAPRRKKAGYFNFIHGVEISGLEVLALNVAYNAISKTKNEFKIGKEGPADGISDLIEFSHFAKGELDVRFYYDFNSTMQFVLRINPGLATPISRFSSSVPYIKQFYVGGANSNRAWQIRELGPGAYHDTLAEDTRFSFYQTGDVKLDMSAEFRFPLFWYVDGAVFIDAANVWTLNADPDRMETQFEFKDFLSELGVGYGWGLRLDLDYFIIRADFGYKLFSPYILPETNSKVYDQSFPVGADVQIAVGLPF